MLSKSSKREREKSYSKSSKREREKSYSKSNKREKARAMAGAGEPAPQQLLKDIRVSVTGLSDYDREMVRVAVQSRGGVYSADLSRACTHLLAASRTGAKYKAAVRWGLHCVRPSWLVEVCLTSELGREEDFAVPEAGISREKVRDELGVLGEREHEIDARNNDGGGGGRRGRKKNATDAAVEKAAAATATTTTTTMAKDGGAATRRRSTHHQKQQAHYQQQQPQKEREEQRQREESEDFEYLSGIQVYITGVDEGPLKQQLVRALRRGGATRRAEMALDDVTHIVLGDKSNALEPAAMKSGRGWLGATEAETLRRAVSSTPSSLAPVPFVVRPAWLLRCNAERKRIPETSDIVAPEDIAAAIGRHHGATHHTKLANGAAGPSLAGTCEDDACGAQRRAATLARQRSGNAFDAATTVNGIVQQHENPAEHNNVAALQPGAQQQQQQQQQQTSSVFANLYFGVALGGAAQQQAARQLILKGQGSVSSGITLAKEDYVVLPLSNPGLGSRRPGGAVQVTLMWLERCLEEGKLLDPAVSPLFHPLQHKLPLDAMRGLRVCVSGYAGIERFFVERLSKALGCKFNDKLTRSTAFLVCCDTKSEKFVKAQEWGATCVTIDWLNAAAKEGAKPDAERFKIAGAEDAVHDKAAGATTSVRRTTTNTNATTTTATTATATVHRRREVAPKLDSTQNTVVVMPTIVEKRRPLQFKNDGEFGGEVGTGGDAAMGARTRRKSISAAEDANGTNSYEDKIQQKDLLDKLNNELKAARPANAEPSMARKRPPTFRESRTPSRSKASDTSTAKKKRGGGGGTSETTPLHGPLMMKATSMPRSSGRRQRQQQQQQQPPNNDSLMDPPSQRVVWEHIEGDDSAIPAATATRSKRGRRDRGKASAADAKKLLCEV